MGGRLGSWEAMRLEGCEAGKLQRRGKISPQRRRGRREKTDSPQRHRGHGGELFFPGRETTPRENDASRKANYGHGEVANYHQSFYIGCRKAACFCSIAVSRSNKKQNQLCALCASVVKKTAVNKLSFASHVRPLAFVLCACTGKKRRET